MGEFASDMNRFGPSARSGRLGAGEAQDDSSSGVFRWCTFNRGGTHMRGHLVAMRPDRFGRATPESNTQKKNCHKEHKKSQNQDDYFRAFLCFFVALISCVFISGPTKKARCQWPVEVTAHLKGMPLALASAIVYPVRGSRLHQQLAFK